MSGVLERGPRETAFGRTGDEVVNNPLLRDKIRNMFGTVWAPGGKLVRGAVPYLERTEAPRGVRIGDRNYVAVTGCVPATGRTARVVRPIQEGGHARLALLDVGGFPHRYAHWRRSGLRGPV